MFPLFRFWFLFNNILKLDGSFISGVFGTKFCMSSSENNFSSTAIYKKKPVVKKYTIKNNILFYNYKYFILVRRKIKHKERLYINKN